MASIRFPKGGSNGESSQHPGRGWEEGQRSVGSAGHIYDLPGNLDGVVVHADVVRVFEVVVIRLDELDLLVFTQGVEVGSEPLVEGVVLGVLVILLLLFVAR